MYFPSHLTAPFSSCDALHDAAGFYNCPELAKDLPQLLSEVCEKGATCSLNPQYDASERWDGLDELYFLLDVLICNEVRTHNR